MDKISASEPVMHEALERFEESQDGSQHIRDLYYEDTKFARMSDQWPDDIKKQRIQEGRPALVINKLPALIRSIVNESRQNKPSIQVSPVDNGADEDTAEVIGGLVRSIERNSNAEVAYDTAIDHAVTGGMGFFRIDIDYAHEDSFDLEARIERVPNALMVHWDTSSTKFDASDWNYAFVSEMVNKDDYKERYPNASLVPFDTDDRDSMEQWWNDEDIRVAEYFLKTEKKRQLIQLATQNPQTGQTTLQAVREDELVLMAKAFFEAGGVDVGNASDDELIRGYMEMAGVEERRRREASYNEVTRRIINGVEVLEEEVWPGSMIPICPVWGEEIYIDGKRNFKGMIRDAKDSQMMFNFWRSATTELVALAPKAPWVGPKGFVPKGDEAKWASANTRNHSYLEYDPASGGVPTRQAFAGVPAGALQEAMNASEDMQAITGVYPSSIGARSNETSGKAILARERQGDISNFHFVDNLSRAIRYAGQVLVDIIPSVYSERETIRILGEDQAENVIKLTQEGGGTRKTGESGSPELYNLTVGKYDVTVSSGPNFATQREETRETLIEIMRQVPDAAPFIGDVLLDHMDFVGADKVAKRLKHLLPPEVRAAESDEVTSADNPEAAALQQQLQAKDAEMKQAQEAVMAEIQKMQQENEALKADKSAEMQRTQMDGQAKMKELAIKEAELALKAREPVVTPEQQWAYDRDMKLEEQAFAASENDKNRQVDLAKAILAKQPTENAEGSEGDNEDGETAMALAMMQAAEMMAAPKRVVRDEFGQIVGVEPIVPDVTVIAVEEDVMQ